MAQFKSMEEAIKALQPLEQQVQKETQEFQDMQKNANKELKDVQNENVLPLAEKDARLANVVLEYARIFDWIVKEEKKKDQTKDS